jgi:resuscitation-promoting factor RpfA
MGWRTGNLPLGWGWLEPVLIGVTLLIAVRAAAASVRVRVPRPRPRRSRLPTPLRSAISWLSLTLSLSASPAMASGRFQAPPTRSGRPLPEAPWSGTSGFLPPHPLVPPGSEPLGTPANHPAIHGDTRVSDDLPRLFERARKPSETDQKDSGGSKPFHPPGSPQPVFVTRKPSVSVNRGDCLWAIAAEVLATDDPARIDRYWKEIFAANRSVIGTDPDKLFPGQILELPRDTTE